MTQKNIKSVVREIVCFLFWFMIIGAGIVVEAKSLIAWICYGLIVFAYTQAAKWSFSDTKESKEDKL